MAEQALIPKYVRSLKTLVYLQLLAMLRKTQILSITAIILLKSS